MLIIKYTTSIFLLMSTSLPSPYNLYQDICYVKLEVIIFKCNLLRIYWGTSAAYIHELPTKYPRVKILDPRNTHEKKIRPTKQTREIISYSENTHEKKSWTHEIPTRKNLEHTKARWHDDTHDCTRLKECSPLKFYPHAK